MRHDHDQLLRSHGVQVTAQRLALLRAVSSRSHATADELAEAVRVDLGTISRQAVYATQPQILDLVQKLIRYEC